jgi:hypothetical protein
VQEQLRQRLGFDHVVALLALLLTAAGYVDAWTRLEPVGSRENLGAWSDAGAIAIWFALSAVLVFTMRTRLARGRRWAHALPTGYMGVLAGCGVFGAATIVDSYWQLAFGPGTGIELLLRPTHLLQIVGGVLIAVGPLQAAIKRGDLRAHLPALLSAALFVAAIAFTTQWLSPLVDLWPAAGANAPAAPSGWWSFHLGVASILLEATLLSGTVLLVVRSFEVRPGSLTFVCLVEGLLLATLKMRWWLVPAPAIAGLFADLVLIFARPSRSRPRQAWLLGSLTALTFSGAYFVELALGGGVTWSVQLCIGVTLLTAVAGWLIGRVMYAVLPATPAWEESWTGAGTTLITAPAVKSALEAMHDLRTLGTSPLTQLPWIQSDGPAAAAELKEQLVRAVDALVTSPDPRDAEAGRLLSDYYVKRVGSHELIAARQHLSRPTFYRRLQRGFERVADHLEEVTERDAAPSRLTTA